MSSISLPPFKQKFKIDREIKGKAHSILGDGEKTLQEIGAITGTMYSREILLDPGTVLKIEGFSATLSTGWPLVKTSIFPEGKKSCQFYIDLDMFDGISWSMITEVKKKTNIIKRITITPLSCTFGEVIKNDRIWHESFDSYFDLKAPSKKVLNPQKLAPEEIDAGEFKKEDSTRLFDINVKVDKTNTQYRVELRTTYLFEIEKKIGFMRGDLKDMHSELVILEPNYYNNPTEENKVIASFKYNQEQFKKMVKISDLKDVVHSELKRIHNI